mgnify:CR=1 FL=1
MNLLLTTLFGIFLNTGVMTDSTGNFEYSIQCYDSDPCYTEMELKKGFHVFTTPEYKVTLIVTDIYVVQLGEQTIRIVNLGGQPRTTTP